MQPVGKEREGGWEASAQRVGGVAWELIWV